MLKLNVGTKHKAACSHVLPCARCFQLANPRRNLLAHRLTRCEGSCSISPLPPPPLASPQSETSTHPSRHCDLLPPRTWAPSCSFTAQNQTELRSFFNHCQANGCCDVHKAPAAAWVFSKRCGASGRAGVRAECAAGSRGRGGGGGDAHSEAGLGHVPCIFCLARSLGSNAPVSPSHPRANWQQTPRSHPQTQPEHTAGATAGRVPGFSS